MYVTSMKVYVAIKAVVVRSTNQKKTSMAELDATRKVMLEIRKTMATQ